MLRAVLVLCWLTRAAGAQPAPPAPPGITAEPAPPSTSPPVAYPPPPPNAPPAYGPSYEAGPREPRSDRFFLALGVLVGGSDESNWLYGAYTGELAATILPADALRVRARAFGVLYGGTMESDWNGDFQRLGAGLEGRYCTAGLRTCLFADLDAGYQKLSLYDGSSDFVRSDTGVFAGPRFGFDWGGGLRLRFALELYEHFAHHKRANGDTSFEAFGTVGISVTLGYQL